MCCASNKWGELEEDLATSIIDTRIDAAAMSAARQEISVIMQRNRIQVRSTTKVREYQDGQQRRSIQNILPLIFPPNVAFLL